MTSLPTLYLPDTSALVRAAHDPTVRVALTALAEQALLATCVTVDLEVGYSARTPAEHSRLRSQRAALLVDLPITETVCGRAREVQGLLAERSQHRAAGALDILTAAVAEEHGAIVLHYDSDFDHIAAVTGQPTRWVVARGSAR